MPPSVSLADATAAKPQRRKREELEQLAAEFVNSRIHFRAPPPPRVPKAAVAAGAVAALAALIWLVWPSDDRAPVREAAPAVDEAEAWAKRLEAERERKRAELQRSREFLERMAAADAALVQDMSERARNLAAWTEPAPAPATAAPRQGEPTPRSTPVASAPAAAPPRAAAAAPPKTAATGPVQPAPARDTAERDARSVQVAAAPNCGIHVSELSSSGKLTYADVARMKGARTDGRGHVFTPPVEAAGRTVQFEVMPDGCVRLVRTAGR